MPSPLCAASCYTPVRAPPPLLRFRSPSAQASASLDRAAPAVSDDLVLRVAEQLEDSVTSSSPLLDPLRSASALSLLSTPWPTRCSSEAFRFTDTSYLRSLPSRPPDLAPPASPFVSHVHFSDRILVSSSGAHVSALANLPPGRARDRAAAVLAASAEFAHKDLFYDFNAVGVRDVVVVHVPEGVKAAEDPVRIMFSYTNRAGGSMLMSNPRVLVVAEKEAQVSVVEDHFGAGEGAGGCYWANPVMEIVVDEGARVVHSYVQQQSFAAAHTKWTVVKQVRCRCIFCFHY
jgi:Fe-S cluster assembly protein SufD